LFLYVLAREAMPQLIQNLLIGVPSSAGLRVSVRSLWPNDLATQCRFALPRGSSFAPLLDCGTQRPDRRAALFCGLIANRQTCLQKVSIFGDQRERKRLIRECDLIAGCAKLDRQPKNSSKPASPQVGIAWVDEAQVLRIDMPASDLSQPLDCEGDAKFGPMHRFEAHRFIGDPAVASNEHHRLADVIRGGRDI
jgi:hypothetical protein